MFAESLPAAEAPLSEPPLEGPRADQSPAAEAIGLQKEGQPMNGRTFLIILTDCSTKVQPTFDQGCC